MDAYEVLRLLVNFPHGLLGIAYVHSSLSPLAPVGCMLGATAARCSYHDPHCCFLLYTNYDLKKEKISTHIGRPVFEFRVVFTFRRRLGKLTT